MQIDRAFLTSKVAQRIFFLFALLTFLVVCLLSVVLIRKSLVPIEILR